MSHFHEINGEQFILEYESEKIIIKHPTWSIIGSGISIEEAEHNLWVEALEIYFVLYKIPLENLSQNLINLLNFIHNKNFKEDY